MKTMQVVAKLFSSSDEARREVQGYNYFTTYYEDVPKLIDVEGRIVKYQDVATGSARIVCDELMSNEEVDLSKLFKKLSTLALQEGKLTTSEGGTHLFYIKRLDRITPNLYSAFSKWCKHSKQCTLNGVDVPTDCKLIDRISLAVDAFRYGFCVPSQGDLHERNVLTDGTIIDFEGAGRNLLATDVATFIWHTLFAGSYFGVRYAKWSNEQVKKMIPDTESVFKKTGSELTFRLEKNRYKLIEQYRTNYLNEIGDSNINFEVVEDAIVFRLLTTFNIEKMTKYDSELSFALASFFGDKTLSFSSKLETLIHYTE